MIRNLIFTKLSQTKSKNLTLLGLGINQGQLIRNHSQAKSKDLTLIGLGINQGQPLFGPDLSPGNT